MPCTRFVSRSLQIVAVVIAANALARAQDPDRGQTEFLSKCAECHGADGKGAGPMSSKLKTKPADLTMLTKKNSGVFSTEAIAEIIDGRSATRPHRSSAMPVWGCRQRTPLGRKKRAREPKPIDSFLDIPRDPEEVIRKRILDIVEYLVRIQEK